MSPPRPHLIHFGGIFFFSIIVLYPDLPPETKAEKASKTLSESSYSLKSLLLPDMIAFINDYLYILSKPLERIELPTFALRKHCSPTELQRRFIKKKSKVYKVVLFSLLK